MLMTRCRCVDSRRVTASQSDSLRVIDAQRFDPTGTLDIRSAWKRDMDRRWVKLRKLAMSAIDRNESMGLVSTAAHEHASQNVSFLLPAPLSSGDRVKAFQAWIDHALDVVILENSGAWTRTYIDQTAARALKRASKITARVVSADGERVQTLASLAVTELQGVMEAVSQQAVRVFAQGQIARQRPSQVARNVSAVVNSIGTRRGRLVVEAMTNKTFNAVTLDAFKSLGIQKVGTVPERIRIKQTAHGKTMADNVIAFDAGKKQRGAKSASTIARREKEHEQLQALGEVEVLTAGDDAVCEECQDISDQGPYPIDEALSLIPAHPNCRCAFVPAADERFADVSEDSATVDEGPPDEARDPQGRWTSSGSEGAFEAHNHLVSLVRHGGESGLHELGNNAGHIGTRTVGPVGISGGGYIGRMNFIHQAPGEAKAKIVSQKRAWELLKQHGMKLHDEFDPDKHPHAPAGSPQGGQFTSSGGGGTSAEKFSNKGTAAALKSAVPELKYFKATTDAKTGNTILMASTHRSPLTGTPETVPGDKVATGIKLNVDHDAKLIQVVDLNSHIPGAGRAMVEAVIAKNPGWKFKAIDASSSNFWTNVKAAHPEKFKS